MPMTGASSSRRAPLGRVVMVQGTSSHAGKTTLVAALCRIFARAGHRAAPFKAQNMSNNAAVSADGGEIGRAQALQAMAARVPCTVDMNPVLLKPQSDLTSQIIVLGRAGHTRTAREYYALRTQLWPVVTAALDRLRRAHDVVVIEGAGSPAEINLAQYDIVNMRVARYADAPVLLVGDIERGGVFASLYGTVSLLPPDERTLIKGFIINKFRGDPALLPPGFDVRRNLTDIPTLGVLDYLDLSMLPAEDALEWGYGRWTATHRSIDIVIARLPRIANVDEFQPLINEPGVCVRFVVSGDEVGSPDLVIVPGTKSTMADLQWLRARGLAREIARLRNARTPILGVCGGFQMLGRRLVDEGGAESPGAVDGLGLLPTSTTFERDKVTRRVLARVKTTNSLWPADDDALHSASLDAYEIHMGRLAVDGDNACRRAFDIDCAGASSADGFVSDDGLVVGTYLHGLFENTSLRRALIRALAGRRGAAVPPLAADDSVDAAIDRLADAVCARLDMRTIFSLAGLDAPDP